MNINESRRPLSFEENLERLPQAFERGLLVDSSQVITTLKSAAGKSFTVIGSGASYSTAIFLCKFLEQYFGIPARAKTPYDYYTSSGLPEGVIIVSASGKNQDILAALDMALINRVSPLVIVTSDPDGQLLKNAARYPGLVVLVIDITKHKEREGFFGVQSLVSALGACLSMIPSLREAIMPSAQSWCSDLCKKAEVLIGEHYLALAKVFNASHVVGLATGWALPCLSDFESKFVEGGLGWIEIAEAKNFSHGRFMNSLRRKEDTAVIFFNTKDSKDILDAFNENYGSIIPIFPVASEADDALGGVELFIYMFYLFHALANHRHVNVSHPQVPEESRRMFNGAHLYPNLSIRDKVKDHIEKIVIAKRAVLKNAGFEESDIEQQVPEAVVAASYSFFLSRKFSGLLCDYDGTLVPLHSPDEILSDELIDGFERLLKANIPIAIVTGRGRSVVRSLQRRIAPSLRHNVFCYLYNGGVLQMLAEDEPSWVEELKDVLWLEDLLRNVDELSGYSIEIASLKSQITIHLRDGDEATQAVNLVKRAMSKASPQHYSISTSGRSVDIFPASVSKPQAYAHFKRIALKSGQAAQVLIIGDRGEADGNDFWLLQEKFSFSVNELHWTPTTCFPVLNQEGDRLFGPRGATSVLQRITVNNGQFSI